MNHPSPNLQGFTQPSLLPLLILALAIPACSGNPKTSEPTVAPTNEKTHLFDGQTLAGWTQRGGHADYRVEDGCIVGSTRPNQANSFLCTTRDFADFDLEFDFKVDPALNSGVQFRSLSSPDYQNGRVHGYQFEIDPSERAWTAGIYDEGRAGWLNDLKNNRPAQLAFKQNDWNHARLLAVGDHIQTWLNGVPAADLHDATTASGFIALQVHAVGDRADPLEIRWKNLRIRPLP